MWVSKSDSWRTKMAPYISKHIPKTVWHCWHGWINRFDAKMKKIGRSIRLSPTGCPNFNNQTWPRGQSGISIICDHWFEFWAGFMTKNAKSLPEGTEDLCLETSEMTWTRVYNVNLCLVVCFNHYFNSRKSQQCLQNNSIWTIRNSRGWIIKW